MPFWALANKYTAAANRSDAAGLAALNAEDGQLLPPNSDFITGRQAIQAYWEALMDRGIKGASARAMSLGGLGGLVRCGKEIRRLVKEE